MASTSSSAIRRRSLDSGAITRREIGRLATQASAAASATARSTAAAKRGSCVVCWEATAAVNPLDDFAQQIRSVLS